MKVRVAIDCALAALYVAVMATALVQEAPHEYLGVALFAAIIAHIVANRRWFKAIPRGRYNAVRILQLATIVGLLACIVAQVASSLVLSKHAFGFLPALPGSSWARQVHLLCSYWGFMFAFAHMGLQFKGFRRLVRPRAKATGDEAAAPAAIWAARIVLAGIACYGVYSFIQAGIGSYLLGQVQFAYANYEEPLVLAFARYASIAVLVAGVFHYMRRSIEGRGK